MRINLPLEKRFASIHREQLTTTNLDTTEKVVAIAVAPSSGMLTDVR